jgi:hypothetical protein
LARWCKGAKASSAQRRIKKAKARRLEVIGVADDKRGRAIIVRLPSGVSIELGEAAALSGDFLTSLATLGGSDATSR